jgi:hypothetical protein
MVNAVAAALAAAHKQLASAWLEVADAQAQALHEAQAGAVERGCDQSRLAFEAGQEPAHLLAREHDRQSAGLKGAAAGARQADGPSRGVCRGLAASHREAVRPSSRRR